MNRRDFLAISVAMTLVGRSLLVRGADSKVRAAVVIGVDKPGNLTKLKGAASGAQSVASWLGSEGFEVKIFTDESGPVMASAIYAAIAELVNRGTLDQLVVYFAGHGFIGNYAEFWMLSGAPENPNEAISLRESMELAKNSGIPNVVFISDACRSRPDSFQSQLIRGSLIFPNRAGGGAKTYVDVFLATLIGDASLEVSLADSILFEGIYTAAFLSAFKRPDDEMVFNTIDGLRVVPNRRLEPYLTREVTKRAETVAKRKQVPDSTIPSPDANYIGRVVATDAQPSPPAVAPMRGDPSPRAAAEVSRIIARGPGGNTDRTEALPITAQAFDSRIIPAGGGFDRRLATGGGSYVTADAKPTIRDLATSELSRVGLHSGEGIAWQSGDSAFSQLDNATGFLKARDAILRTAQRRDVDLDTGFVVTGEPVANTFSNSEVQTEVLVQTEAIPRATLIKVQLRDARAASIVLQFAGGSGTAIAALRDYIGYITVDKGGVVNVSYVPSSKSWMWPEYEHQRGRIDDLHAAVATSARYGVFRVKSSDAERLASTIRVLKGIDPTLGLYAAYAYADADLPSQVRSVREILRGDLGADLFDIAMLSGALAGRSPNGNDTVPFCPMLSQGWGYLRVQKVNVREAVDRAQDHLLPALWTTFDAAGIQFLRRALLNGQLE